VSVRPSTGIPRSKPARAISLQRRAAFYIDRPLKRAMAADLPVEQPTRFDLAVNLKTARRWASRFPSPFICAPTRRSGKSVLSRRAWDVSRHRSDQAIYR
jgi:hypothetical protein